MNQNIDLKKLERKAYLSYHQDGVPDIILGISLMLFAIEMATNTFFLNLFFPLIIIGNGYYFRKFITFPRLGYAKFSEHRKKIEKQKTIFLAFFGSMLLGAFFSVFFITGNSFGTFEALKAYPLLILALLWGIIPLLGALLLGAKRMYVYAVIIFVFFVPGQAVETIEPVRVFVTGAVIVLLGFLVLAKFVKKHPIHSERRF